MNKTKILNKGFTLLELLVVVLIIGILAAIALPKYQMAVTKAKVATILPLIRAWQNALQEYELAHESLCPEDECPTAEDLGVNWPADWKSEDNPCRNNLACHNDYWECTALNSQAAIVSCVHTFDSDQNDEMDIGISSIHTVESAKNKITCEARGTQTTKVCKALGTLVNEGAWNTYLIK